MEHGERGEIARVDAVWRNGGHRSHDWTVHVLCMLDAEGRPMEGRWFGSTCNAGYEWPFIFQAGSGEFRYGGGSRERTNLGGRPVHVNEMFTVWVLEDNVETAYTLEITDVRRLLPV